LDESEQPPRREAPTLLAAIEAGVVAEESLPSGGVGYRVRSDDAGDGAGPTRSAGEPGGAQAATSG
jgi:hypothetical protein